MMLAMSVTPENGTERGAVKSADRALAVLDLVGERGVVRFTDLVTELGLPRSSAHGLLQTLVSRGWLEHDPVSRQFSLGLRVWQLGQRYAGHRDVATLAKPVMDELAAELGETVQMARLDGVENVYIAISEAPRPMRLASSVGMRLHAHGTGIGKALLSQLDPAEARRRLAAVELPRFTDHTLTDVAQLVDVLDRVREQGYALDDEEYLPGCRCVAVPLPVDGNGGLQLALSVTAPVFRCGPDWPQAPLAALQAGAARIRERVRAPEPGRHPAD
jgi:DNA-binding IclR family transcriptional regulator